MIIRAIFAAWAIWGLFLIPFAGETAAHTRSQSMSALSVDGDIVTVNFRVTAREVTRLGVLDPQAETLPALLATHLARSLIIEQEGSICALLDAPQPRAATNAELRFELRYRCAQPAASETITFTNNAFFPIASRHIHFARARASDGSFDERLITATNRSSAFDFSGGGRSAPIVEPASTTLWRYVVLGAEHIWIGIDHLAFLIGLLLLCQRLRDVVFVVTGFTIGHSITLSLTVLGLAVPDPPVVEALIAFTIVIIAVEAVVTPKGLPPIALGGAVAATGALALLSVLIGGAIPLLGWVGLALLVGGYGYLTRDTDRARRLLPMLTLVFGLIHGFGFAGVLLELGLPTDRLALALFGFNVGVEIGQVIFVAAAWMLVLLIGPRLPKITRAGFQTTTAGVLCIAGSYWFALRAFG